MNFVSSYRNLIKLTACAALALGMASLAAPAHAGNHGMPVDFIKCTTKCHGVPLSGYKMIYSNEFNAMKGISDDGRGVGPLFTGGHAVLATNEKFARCTDPRILNVKDGVLVMSTAYDADGKYIEAHLQSRDNHNNLIAAQNFYAEVRLRGPVDPNNHSGIWFLGVESGQGHPEFDLLEQYGPADRYDHSSSHQWSPTEKHIYTSSLVARPEGSAMAWHTYGLEATDEWMYVYRDNALISQIKRTKAQRVPLYMLLSLFGNPGLGKPVPTTMLVDYVRMYVPKPEYAAKPGATTSIKPYFIGGKQFTE